MHANVHPQRHDPGREGEDGRADRAQRLRKERLPKASGHDRPLGAPGELGARRGRRDPSDGQGKCQLIIVQILPLTIDPQSVVT